MKALDDAVKAALDAVPGLTDRVYFGSPLRDTRPDFVSFFPIDSGRGPAGFYSDDRYYVYEVIAAHRSGISAEAMKELAEETLIGKSLPVEGWNPTQLIIWDGDIHDLGDLVVDGTTVKFAGFKANVNVGRDRPVS